MITQKEINMCGAKKRHHTYKDAHEHKLKLLKSDKNIKLNVYQCQYCHYWHVGRARDYEGTYL
jgi:hypothetical protein